MTNPRLTGIDEARTAFRTVSEGKRQALTDYRGHKLTAAEARRKYHRLREQAYLKARVDGESVEGAKLIAAARAADAEFECEVAGTDAMVALKTFDLHESDRAGVNRLAELSAKADPMGLGQ